jgi:hypothetical protein
MKCFYNPSEDAIGTCKSCGKGLSFSYATEYPKGLACKGKCEADVQNLIALVDQNVAMRSTSASLVRGTPSGLYAAFLLYFIMGGAFIWMGSEHDGLSPILFIGVAFLGFGIYTLIRAQKLTKVVKKTEQDAAANP